VYILSEEQKRDRGLPSVYDQRPELPSPPSQPALPSPSGHTAVEFGPPDGPAAVALPAPPAPAKKELPAPKSSSGTAIQKALFSSDATALALPDANGGELGAGDGWGLSLPPAVAARLRSLLDRHENGKTLTAAERAEAQGLLDIAEFFVVQRLRKRLAA
jgi:hypothetical protein